jgi:hypothetical protein
MSVFRGHMFRRLSPWALGLAVVAGLLGFARFMDADPQRPFVIAPTRVSGLSPYGSCRLSSISSDTYQQNYVNTEVEPRVAVNPRTVGSGHLAIVGVWQQDRWFTAGARGLVAGYSSDGGRTWAISPLPFSACAPGGIPMQAASDPWISIGPDGTAYAAGVVLTPFGGAVNQGVAAATSTDGGRSWSNAQVVASDSVAGLSDKASVTADPRRPGVAYLVWDRTGGHGFPPAQPMWFARTADGGKTWSRPQQIPQAEGQTIGHEIVVDPRSGTLYDFFSRVDEHAHEYCDPETEDCSNTPYPTNAEVIMSSDEGNTWSHARTIARFVAVGPGAMAHARVRTGARLVEAAIDPGHGELYAVWEDSRFHRGGYDTVAISTSRDAGNHWTKPQEIPAVSGVPAITPAVAATLSGVVGVTYYTLTATQDGGLEARSWFTSSTAGTLHFGRPVPLSPPFNLLTAPYSDGFFLGDYEGLTAAGGSFVSLLAVTNSGNLTNRTDIDAVVLTP